MALQNKTKSINLTATSVVSGLNVAMFSANFDSQNLENMVPMRSILDSSAYRANRSEVMQDQTDFEVEAYALLDSMKKTNDVAPDETI
ncbi:MAG: hypothetical protein RSB35_06225 [Eubacterium sp.]